MGTSKTINIGGKSKMKNTWDYKKGDLIKVEKLGWEIETGVITKVFEESTGSPAFPRKYWEWTQSNGRHHFFFEVKSPLQEDFKIKVLARNTNV
jgi:hypothetical protein